MSKVFEYVKAGPLTTDHIEKLNLMFQTIADYVDQFCPGGREKSLAMTKLEETAMWAKKSLTHGPNGEY